MNYQYFIAVNRDAYMSHVRSIGSDFVSCKFINDRHQLAGLSNITIKVIGYGNRQLESEIVLHYSHRGIKLEYI